MNLTEYYRLNFVLLHRYQWSLEYLDQLMPFEKDIYLSLLQEHQIKESEINNLK